ncbi:MAG: DUF5683 domain-containing protein [Melioribacteraceae bacterium]|nr:DUF5683 domain-containing protein [Melioribacteraceae bacterium]
MENKLNKQFLFFTLSFLLFTFSFIFSFQLQADTTYKFKSVDSLKFEMKKSPIGALVRSALIPGLGQFYNESYWKIPVIIGAFGYLGYQWNNNDNLYKKYRDLYYKSINNNQGNLSYYKLREFYRDQRDLFAIYIGLAYLLNLFDAYVDAHLYDFNVEENTLYKNLSIAIRIKL